MSARALGALAILALLCAAAPPAASPPPLSQSATAPGGARAELRQLSRRLARGASRLEALADLYALEALRPHLVDPAALDAQLERTTAGAAVHPIVRDHARYLSAMVARRRGDDGRAREQLAATGLVTRALLLGPFDNTGGAAFGAEVIDEREIDVRERHTGLGRDQVWRDITGGAEEGFLDLGARLEPAQASVAYLLFTVRADRPTAVALRIGTSDQVCARVGAAPARCFDERHPWSFEQHAIGAQLSRGTTPVLLRLGNIDGRFRTTLRLTRPDGAPLGAAVTVDVPGLDQRVSLQAAPARLLDQVVDAAEAMTAAAARGSGAGRARRQVRAAQVLWALQAFDRRLEPSPVLELLDAARGRGAETAEQLQLRADALSEHEPNAARDALQRATALPFAPARAWLSLAQHRLDRQLYAEALDLLVRAQALDPDDPEIAVASADAVAGLDPDPSAGERVIEAFARDHQIGVPDDGSPPTGLGGAAARRLLSQLRSQRLFAQVQVLAAALLAADRTDGYALRTLLAEDERAADLTAALARLDEMVRQQPQSRVPRLERARFLAWNDAPAEAAAALAELAQRYPDHADVEEARGEALMLAGQPEAAAGAWRQSLRLRPQQPELARRLEALALAPDPLERYQLDMAALRRAPTPASAKPFGVHVLAHTIATRLYDNGLTSTVEDFAVRLLDRDFADAIRTRRLYYSSGREQVTVLVAERVDRQGRSSPPASVRDLGPGGRADGVYSDRGAKEIRFGALEVGDVVRVRTRTDAVGQINLFGDFYGQVVSAQGSWPVRRFDLFVEAPRQRPLALRAEGLQQEVRPVEGDGALTRYHVWAEALPGRPLEPNMPPLFELVPHVSVSTYARWEDLVRWYTRLIEDQYQLDEETRALARKLVAGAETAEERVRRLHDYVVKKTRYVGVELGIHGWKPYRASLVHRRGYGDCKDKAVLLIAMLEAVGIEAQLVLVRTVDLGELAPDPPTMWAFNHAIAYVPALDLYLDGTAEFSGLEELPDLDQGARVLRVGRDGSWQLARIPVAPPEANLNHSEYVVHLDQEGTARLVGTERFRGTRSAQLRRRFADPATRREQLEKDFSEAFAGARVEEVAFSALEDLNAEVSYSFEATIPRRAQLVEKGMVLPLSLYPHELARAFTPSRKRHHDLVFRRRWRTRNVMRYVLPPGLALASLPAPVTLETPHLGFWQRVERTPDGFVVDETTEWRSRRVARADYAALRAVCLQADAAMQQRVKLSRLALGQRAGVNPELQAQARAQGSGR